MKRKKRQTSAKFVANPIEARMARAGGTATIFSEPGQGTEVELTMPRGAS